jgi:hypothetical protein
MEPAAAAVAVPPALAALVLNTRMPSLIWVAPV